MLSLEGSGLTGQHVHLGLVRARQTGTHRPGIALDSDRLYPLSPSHELADALPGCEGVDLLHSDVLHDGFLVESAALNKLVAGLLERVDDTTGV